MLAWRFVWFVPLVAIVIAAGWLWLEWIGLPHFAWRYTFVPGPSARMSERTYLSCTYVGPYGSWTEAAVQGSCPWFAWRTPHIR